jgi:hypothetical protein
LNIEVLDRYQAKLSHQPSTQEVRVIVSQVSDALVKPSQNDARSPSAPRTL